MAINVSVQSNGGFLPRHDTVDPMSVPLGTPIKYHEEFLSLHPIILPKRFGIPPPDWGMLRKGLNAFRFFLKQ